MAGIHVVQTQPAPIEAYAAVWDPNDEYQRVAVLAWLSATFGSDFRYEYGNELGGLYIFLPDRDFYVPPGSVIVLDPQTGEIVVQDEQQLNEHFTYVRPIVDPQQPALFDLLAFIA